MGVFKAVTEEKSIGARASSKACKERKVKSPCKTRKKAEKERDGANDSAAPIAPEGFATTALQPLKLNDIGEITEEHKRLFGVLRGMALNCIDSGTAKPGLEGLKLAKAAVDVVTALVKGERLVWGMEEKGGDDWTDDVKEIAQEMEALTVSSGADEVMD